MKTKSIGLLAFAFGMMGTLVTSCDSMIYDGVEPCPPVVYDYSMRFVYDRNMKFADAFAHEVKAVTVHAITPDGTVAWTKSESGEALAEKDYTMSLPAEQGSFSYVAWCTTNDGDAYAFGGPTRSAGRAEDLTCTINRADDGGGVVSPTVAHLPALFHGQVAADFTERDTTKTVVMALTKNTNNIRVMLQQQGGAGISASDFEFEITDDNGAMAYDNTLMPDVTMTYKPWDMRQGETTSVDATGNVTTTVNVAIAEFTIGRLMEDRNPRLTVRNKQTGETVFTIPVKDYALLIKSNEYAGTMSDQEYLDRQDDYAFTFFLDNGQRWINTHIYINSWRVVLQSVEL